MEFRLPCHFGMKDLMLRKKYPEIKTDKFHIDILTARFVLTPSGLML